MLEGRLQWDFDALMDLFDRVGPRKNIRRIVIIVCQPFHYPGGISV